MLFQAWGKVYRGTFLNISILHPGITNSCWLRSSWSMLRNWLVGKTPEKDESPHLLTMGHHISKQWATTSSNIVSTSPNNESPHLQIVSSPYNESSHLQNLSHHGTSPKIGPQHFQTLIYEYHFSTQQCFGSGSGSRGLKKG